MHPCLHSAHIQPTWLPITFCSETFGCILFGRILLGHTRSAMLVSVQSKLSPGRSVQCAHALLSSPHDLFTRSVQKRSVALCLAALRPSESVLPRAEPRAVSSI